MLTESLRIFAACHKAASSEVDFLNGEIVLLGRLHGVPTPYNEIVQKLAGQLANRGGFSDALPLDDILSRVDNPGAPRQTGLALAQ